MRSPRSLLILLVTALSACVTVNVYFPEGEIRDLSLQIEDEIRRQARGEEEETQAAGTEDNAARASAPWLELLSSAVLGAPVYAQERVPAPEVTNPAIRRIIESRAKRLDAINRFKSDGVLGEAKSALLEIRALDAVSELRDRATVQRLVKDENADREQLYKEIAAATGVESSQIPRIRETYAQTLREQSRSGDWMQMPDGTWRQK